MEGFNRKSRRTWESLWRRKKLHALPLRLFAASDVVFIQQNFPERMTPRAWAAHKEKEYG